MPQSTKQSKKTKKQFMAPPSYDQQASSYDKRVGFSETDCRQIVASVLAISNLQADDVLVEVGTGTGQIGEWFIHAPGQYIGFDVSTGMLDEFRQRLKSDPDPFKSQWQILQADGNQPWPVANASARVIFSSRAIHLLDLEHVSRECHRLAHPGGTLVVFGRIQRSKESIRDQMQKQLQQLLKKHGLKGRQGDRRQRKLLDVLIDQGAEPIDPIKAVRWPVAHSPADSLKSWQGKSGLGGNDISDELKTEILSELEGWAIAQFGDLEQVVNSEEGYVLQGVWLK
ncbi:MAG: class I SAM-dependent methyltransferase [Merismopedia sp. SIO2A8]|nr:class I SAM-dependent methyltransferase [Symploca sp. SIO2B6]NET52692.1 class I SAM-dependent methyltransferase [Merismopedia sp. SIO2A8]